MQPWCRGLEAPPGRVNLACSEGACLVHGTLFTFSWPWALGVAAAPCSPLGTSDCATAAVSAVPTGVWGFSQQTRFACVVWWPAGHGLLFLEPWSFYLNLRNAVADPQGFGTGKVIL